MPSTTRSGPVPGRPPEPVPPPGGGDGIDTSRRRGGTPAPFAVRHRRLVCVVALLLMALAAVGGHGVAERLSSGGIVPPGAESLRAEEVLRRDFKEGRPGMVLLARTHGAPVARAHGTPVTRTHGTPGAAAPAAVPGAAALAPVDAPAVVAAARAVERRLAAEPGVVRVRSYWSTGRMPALRARDGRGALVLAWLRGGDHERGRTAERVVPGVTGRFGPLEVTAGGEAATRVEVARQASRDARRSELVALPVTVTLLLLVFGSLVAAALPVLVGVFAALGTTALLRRLADHTEVSVYAINIGTALAFALAIDYSLFLVSRYREERANGAGTAGALHTALRTAGRAVAFSAGTVACSMAALLVFPHPLLRSLGCAGVAVTVMAAVGSLVVLPAVLAMLGDRLDRLDVFARWRRPRPDRATPPGGHRAGPGGRGTPLGGWGRVAVLVMRRPLVTGVPVACLLVLLAVPFAGVRFAVSDDRVLPAGTAAGGVGAALRRDFADPPVDVTTVVLPDLDARARPGAVALDHYARRVSAVPGVRRVDTATGTYREGRRGARPSPASARFVARHRDAGGAYLSVVTAGAAGDPANADRVGAIRDVPAPARAWVGGPGARVADVRGAVGERLPLALTLVGASMFVLVLGLTRKPVLAVKALALNTLSLCATFGALVLVFQRGHLGWLVGDFAATGSLDVQIPVVTFCVAFGLSMDYECMLLSRVVEEHRAGADTETAVAVGLDRTARLFTWSATILAVVMVALATSGLVFLKAVGVGLALAAVLDATVVRGLLVPAVMRLAGRANWWTPARPRSRPGRDGPLVP
ncbi:MMPL family transporter [Streptomyces sp. NPDC016309]|uniref:MMPL family transporter n=1 Tax=Streptomyces sp. NPDC016309 TaxID=3364965 RepID=UPI0036F74248